ncbi:MAG: metal-dependent transcriptional regulator [Desulfobacteraceae bacterium]|nr:MAG: metal-dependent transcriptional regulator [Desulfobacteraceae bacterium]
MTAPNIDAPEKPLTSTMEDYLEAIFDLDQDKKVIRVRDIAKRLDVKMPTVTSMLKTLNDRGLVNYEKYEYVELTDSGASVGREMHRRHQVLFRFLTDILKIDHQTADEEACKMEHSLSVSTLESLTDFMQFIQACPRAGDSWLHYFEEFRKTGRTSQKCEACAKTFSCEINQKAKKTRKNKAASNK